MPLSNADLLTDEEKQDIAESMLKTGEVDTIIYDDDEVEQNDEK